ncbi:MAG: hypothetical protein IKU34_00865 [Clostridia bacterium]|nr:hypothetical protein [Clostridia bacterium]
MDALDKKNVRLVFSMGTVSIACWLISKVLFWYLIDVEYHGWAYAVYFLAALTTCAAALALDAFATALFYGFVRVKKGALVAVCAVLHGAVRVACAFYQGMFAIAGVFDFIMSSSARIDGPLLLTAVAVGYVFLFRFEKRLKAQRALRVTFD